MNMAAAAWALDSGCSQFIVNADNHEDAVWSTVRRAAAEIETANGVAKIHSECDVRVPQTGDAPSLVMHNAPFNMASLGTLVEDMNFTFSWTRDGPSLRRHGCSEVPLHIRNKVPFIGGLATAAAAAMSNFDTFTDGFLENLRADFFAYLAADFGQEFVEKNFQEITDDFAKEFVDNNFPALAAPAAKRNFH